MPTRTIVDDSSWLQALAEICMTHYGMDPSDETAEFRALIRLQEDAYKRAPLWTASKGIMWVASLLGIKELLQRNILNQFLSESEVAVANFFAATRAYFPGYAPSIIRSMQGSESISELTALIESDDHGTMISLCIALVQGELIIKGMDKKCLGSSGKCIPSSMDHIGRVFVQSLIEIPTQLSTEFLKSIDFLGFWRYVDPFKLCQIGKNEWYFLGAAYYHDIVKPKLTTIDSTWILQGQGHWDEEIQGIAVRKTQLQSALTAVVAKFNEFDPKYSDMGQDDLLALLKDQIPGLWENLFESPDARAIIAHNPELGGYPHNGGRCLRPSKFNAFIDHDDLVNHLFTQLRNMRVVMEYVAQSLERHHRDANRIVEFIVQAGSELHALDIK